MADLTAEEAFRRWHVPWKERICEELRPFSHGLVLLSPRHPDFWAYNCIRLDRPMEAGEMIAAADRELAGCAHRLVEWMVPMPDGVVRELRARGWVADPLIFMLHDGRALPEDRARLVEVDYDAVTELRGIWHREGFGEHGDTEMFRAQAREVARLADVRVMAAVEGGRPIGLPKWRPTTAAARSRRCSCTPTVGARGSAEHSPRGQFASRPTRRRKFGSAPSAITTHAGSTSGLASARLSRPVSRSCSRSRSPQAGPARFGRGARSVIVALEQPSNPG